MVIMNVVEFGKENTDIIILLHGGGLSWWNYRETAKLLEDKYRVVLPILDGHAGSDEDFTGIEQNAAEIISYIDKEFSGSVLLIGGVSLGAQILLDILAQRNDICKYAVIESALVCPMKLTGILVKPMLDMSYRLIGKKWFSSLQYRSLGLKAELYPEYYRDTCAITKENMTAFLRANSLYNAKDGLRAVKAKAFVFVGKKERPIMLKSAKKLGQLLPDAKVEVLDELKHGEFSANFALRFAQTITKIIENK